MRRAWCTLYRKRSDTRDSTAACRPCTDDVAGEVVLQGPRVMAIVRELEATGVAKHVRVDREWHLGGLADALDESVETDVADGPAALG